jgi:hypothetical protein
LTDAGLSHKHPQDQIDGSLKAEMQLEKTRKTPIKLKPTALNHSLQNTATDFLNSLNFFQRPWGAARSELEPNSGAGQAPV